MLPPPRIIARLDKVQHGARHHGDSFTSTAGGLKKRAEIVLATDNVGVEIHDIRNARVLVSHSVAPGEKFLCSPVSISVKEKGGKWHERYTYWVSGGIASTRGTARPAKARLCCLYENSDTSQTIIENLPDNSSSQRPISHICLLPGDSKLPEKFLHRVIAIYDDGQASCFDAKLGSLAWQGPIITSSAVPSTEKVYDAVVFDEGLAKSLVFKSRPDVLASLPKRDGHEDQRWQFLALIVGSEASPMTLRFSLVGQRGLVELSNMVLSDSRQATVKSDNWSFHPRSGNVHHIEYGQKSTKICMLDITGITAVSKHVTALKDVSSAIKISSTTVAVISGGSVKLINTKWGSLQEECPLKSSNIGIEVSKDARLVSNFSTLGVLAILQNNAILVISRFESPGEQSSYARKRKVGDTLADAFGRGVGALQMKTHVRPEETSTRREFGKYFVHTANSAEAKQIRDRFEPLKSAKQAGLYDSTMSTTLETAIGIKAKKKTAAPHVLKRSELVTYAINDLFVIEKPTKEGNGSRRRLKVNRMAPDTFRSLLTRGLLSTSFLESTIQDSDSADSVRQLLHPSALIDALISYDTSLQLLIYYLSAAPVLSEIELVAALSHSLRTAEQAEKSDALDVSDDRNGHMSLTNGATDTQEKKSASVRADVADGPSQQGFDDVDWPEPDYKEGVRHNAQSALRSCLERLSVCGEGGICKALKALMQPSELLTLIDYIRTELAAGGWLVRLVDEELEGEADLSMQTSQIKILAKVMNCAVDSLGATAWLLGTTDATDASRNADKIAYMRAEVNAALGGIEESAALEQMIHEVLLFSKHVKQNEKKSEARAESTEPSSGDIVKMKSRQEEREDSMLPLGLRRTGAVPKTKTLPGGREVPRSRRNRAWLENKQVPEYSFERIFI